jgi:hypothetical protein
MYQLGLVLPGVLVSELINIHRTPQNLSIVQHIDGIENSQLN